MAEKFSQLISKVLFKIQKTTKLDILSLKLHSSSAFKKLQKTYQLQFLQSLRNDYLLGFFVFLIAFSAICTVIFRKKTKRFTNPQIRDPRLSTLASFVVPVHSSRFDTRFASFTRTGLAIDLASFIEGIVSGTIEFRNPTHFQALFRDQLLGGRCGGIFPYSGIHWKIRVLGWIYSSYVETRMESFKLAQESPQPRLFLDSIPQQDIEATLSKFLGHLSTGNAKIVFTARNPCVSFMSESFLFSAVPYITRNHTATPLFSSLDHIISCISGFPGVKIISVTNVSEGHTMKLYAAENDLVERTSSRIRFLKQHGERSWREHRLSLIWEAGLHGSGLLNRWVISVKK